MAKVWCEWESAEYERDQFEPYQGGPLLRHLHVDIPHTNNGIGIGPGPAPAGPLANEASPRGPGGWAEDVSYGHGPMSKPPRDE
jgi:hypothetical protein